MLAKEELEEFHVAPRLMGARYRLIAATCVRRCAYRSSDFWCRYYAKGPPITA
jgi:hypothetical protein